MKLSELSASQQASALAKDKRANERTQSGLSRQTNYDASGVAIPQVAPINPPTQSNVNNTPTINGSIIGNQTPLKLASTPNIKNDANAFIGSVATAGQQQGIYDAEASDRQATVDAESAKLSKISDRFNVSDEYNKLQKKAGIPQITKDIQNANLKLTQLQSEYQLTNNEAENQAISSPFQIGLQNEISKTYSIKIGAQAAVVSALQGNYDLANHYVDKMIDLEQKDYTQKYEAQKYNLESAKELLNKTEAKQAKMLDYQLDLQKADYTNLLATKKSTLQNMLLNGASSAQVQEASQAQDINSLMSAAGKYGVDAVAQSQLATDRAQRANIYSTIAERNANMQGTGGVDAKTLSQIQSSPEYKTINGILPAIQTIKDYKSSIEKSGSFEYFNGKESGNKKATYGDAITAWKTLAALGALSGADFGLAENVIPAPSLFTRNSKVNSQLDAALNNAVRQTETLTTRLTQNYPKANTLLNTQLDDIKVTAYPDKFIKGPDGNVYEIN